MKINDLKNIWLTVIYMLFLIMVFVLFAIIRNADSVSGAAYILLFIITIFGSIMYYWGFKQNTAKMIDLTNGSDNQHTESILESEINEVVADENLVEEEIDLKKLLPKEKINPEKFGEEILQNLANEFQINQGLFYIKDNADEVFKCFGQYAYFSDKAPVSFKLGETLPGQAVKNKNIVTLSDIPDKYMTIASGLGESAPRYLTFVPILNKDEVIGLIEFASFKPLSGAMPKSLKQLAEKAGETLTKMIKK